MADFSGDVVGGPPVTELANLERNGEVLGRGVTTLRRALVSGEYIYFTGSPPPGANDIVVMSTQCG
jgi:hypothetical protein